MWVAWGVFAFGCLICLFNFCLSFIRYPLLRWRGMAAGDVRHVSGIPVVGSLLVVLTLPAFIGNSTVFWGGLMIAFLDTGGLHVFACVMLYAALTGRL